MAAIDRKGCRGGNIVVLDLVAGGPTGVIRLIVFDLDGTLAQSKSAIDEEMSKCLSTLLSVVKVAVISGGDWLQFENQLLGNLPRTPALKNLSLLPTSGTKFYRYESKWKKLYSEDLTADEKKKIVDALQGAVLKLKLRPRRTWGQVIEDRGSQITYSGLGQEAPIAEKKKWDPDLRKRQKMKQLLDGRLKEFSVRLGGTTSVDVTKPGIDKAYGIRKLRDVLGVPIDEMIFIGDALFPEGNDYPAKLTGCVSIQVRDPDESKRVIEAIIACLRGASK